jgi:hypothetical protein
MSSVVTDIPIEFENNRFKFKSYENYDPFRAVLAHIHLPQKARRERFNAPQ